MPKLKFSCLKRIRNSILALNICTYFYFHDSLTFLSFLCKDWPTLYYVIMSCNSHAGEASGGILTRWIEMNGILMGAILKVFNFEAISEKNFFEAF